uniref:Uncharacterized protein n=1 Tax=Kalmanozyma brasiliensis (strain GHG001) TaxID=1365824 RepID=V5GU60_KALBG
MAKAQDTNFVDVLAAGVTERGAFSATRQELLKTWNELKLGSSASRPTSIKYWRYTSSCLWPQADESETGRAIFESRATTKDNHAYAPRDVWMGESDKKSAEG